jgi:hypothetical protein
MACNGCKKKRNIAEPVQEVQINIDHKNYQLRDGISYEQLGMVNPSEDDIKEFLEANPNRKSLFQTLPDKAADTASEIETNE